MKIKVLFVAAWLMPIITYSQFAPQAGVPGSTAIAATSGQISGWATSCTVSRGYLDISQPALGYVSAGDSSNATGAVDNSILSLGDSGVATLSFASPIVNGTGADFIVFENGFANPADAEEAFLELAFVAVSSDGINFVRFPAASNTQDTAQIAGAGTYMNARYINNLAGKYTAGYGTPFDLDELKNEPNLDVNHITHVRIIDVVGSIGEAGTRDSYGNPINDPYPTPYPTGGFDLDAVGVIHQQATGVHSVSPAYEVGVYPNPATDYIFVANMATSAQAIIYNITGARVLEQAVSPHNSSISIAALPVGSYYLSITDNNGNKWIKRFLKN